MPRRARSTARVRPAGPAPTMRTSSMMVSLLRHRVSGDVLADRWQSAGTAHVGAVPAGQRGRRGMTGDFADVRRAGACGECARPGAGPRLRPPNRSEPTCIPSPHARRRHWSPRP
jgi:hypothetical protein